MAFIPVLNCVQARLIWLEDNGVTAQNVFWHATTGAPTLDAMEEIGSTWGELMTEAGIGPNTTSNWALSSVALRAMNEEEGMSLNYNGGMPISGTNASPQMPDQVCYTITWSTGLVGRSARGRTYAIGIPGNAIENRNRLTTSAQASFNNTWGVVLESFATAGYALQVVSFQEAGIPRTEGRKLAILSQQVRFPLATRRSRLA